MKTMIKNILAWAMMIAVWFAMVCAAQAAESFNTTNTIPGATDVRSWPTNASGVWTGGAINIANYEWAGLTVQGQGNKAGTTTLGIWLVRSAAGNPPTTTVQSSGLITAQDWETTSAIYVSVTVTDTNAFCWHTNLARDYIGPANWIGVYAITNATTNTMSITNFSVTLNKKIIPTKWP